ncbi:MAG: alpha-L-fucosidase [Candidatus Acidiferrales bacterium]
MTPRGICKPFLSLALHSCIAVIAVSLLLRAAPPGDYQSKLKSRLAMVDGEVAHKDFRANWNSLGRYQVPDWFRDAKFGIFIHWGVYSVPAFGNEWYSRNMYVQGNPAFQHQVDTYGPQSKFGYKDFIPMFTGGKFNADEWVDLFVRAGAKYVVPVAEHCDGFPMYASDFTEWNAARMGPKRDVVGEIAAATRKRNLHFGASSHRAEHWWWYDGGTTFDSDVNDPKYAGLYGPAQPMAWSGGDPAKEPDPNHLEKWLPPNRAFLDDWLARSTEIVDKYHPDILYFDWWIGQPAFQPYLQRMAAYYYDRAAERHAGVVLTYKEYAFPENAAVLDIERGKLDSLRLLPWQTDTSISVKSWGYVQNDTYRTAASLIAELVDVVSKNGNLLLNVGPKSDGTIPDEDKSVLLSMGQWLGVNGEAIYGSRPWLVFGEGPTGDAASTVKGNDNKTFTPQDIRFTTKNGFLYAIALGWPADGKLTIRILSAGTAYLPRPITRIELLGSRQTLAWKQTPQGLEIALPQEKPNDMAYVFKISIAAAK